MKLPKPLTTLPSFFSRSSKRKNGLVIEEIGTDAELHFTVPSVQTTAQQENITKGWKEVNVTVLGDQEITDRVAKGIPIWVPDATEGSNICFDGNSCTQHLAVELTPSTVREGHVTDALVVNITGGPVKKKDGRHLSKCLSYNMNVVTEPMEFLTALWCISLHWHWAGAGTNPTISCQCCGLPRDEAFTIGTPGIVSHFNCTSRKNLRCDWPSNTPHYVKTSHTTGVCGRIPSSIQPKGCSGLDDSRQPRLGSSN